MDPAMPSTGNTCILIESIGNYLEFLKETISKILHKWRDRPHVLNFKFLIRS